MCLVNTSSLLHSLVDKLICTFSVMIITKICLYNFDPLKPHFYAVKLGFVEAVLTSTHNLCFEQKHEKYQIFFFFFFFFFLENFHFLMVKFSIYLNRHVFVIFTNQLGKPAQTEQLCTAGSGSVLGDSNKVLTKPI